jgi:hypothetical protein
VNWASTTKIWTMAFWRQPRMRPWLFST